MALNKITVQVHEIRDLAEADGSQEPKVIVHVSSAAKAFVLSQKDGAYGELKNIPATEDDELTIAVSLDPDMVVGTYTTPLKSLALDCGPIDQWLPIAFDNKPTGALAVTISGGFEGEPELSLPGNTKAPEDDIPAPSPETAIAGPAAGTAGGGGRSMIITVICGTELPGSPQVKLQAGDMFHSTRVKSGDSYPIWSENFDFYVPAGEELNVQTINFDDGSVTGDVVVDLDGLDLSEGPVDLTLEMAGPERLLDIRVQVNESSDIPSKDGDYTRTVTIIRAEGLPITAPHVEITIGRNGDRRTMSTSAFPYDTDAPEWNEAFTIPNFANSDNVDITVKDGHEHNIGGLKLFGSSLVDATDTEFWIPLEGEDEAQVGKLLLAVQDAPHAPVQPTPRSVCSIPGEFAFTLQVFSIEGLDPRLKPYVKLECGSQVEQTSVKDPMDELVWNESFQFSAPEEEAILCRVFCEKAGGDAAQGGANVPIQVFMDVAAGEQNLEVELVDDGGYATGAILLLGVNPPEATPVRQAPQPIREAPKTINPESRCMHDDIMNNVQDPETIAPQPEEEQEFVLPDEDAPWSIMTLQVEDIKDFGCKPILSIELDDITKVTNPVNTQDYKKVQAEQFVLPKVYHGRPVNMKVTPVGSDHVVATANISSDALYDMSSPTEIPFFTSAGDMSGAVVLSTKVHKTVIPDPLQFPGMASETREAADAYSVVRGDVPSASIDSGRGAVEVVMEEEEPVDIGFATSDPRVREYYIDATGNPVDKAYTAPLDAYFLDEDGNRILFDGSCGPSYPKVEHYTVNEDGNLVHTLPAATHRVDETGASVREYYVDAAGNTVSNPNPVTYYPAPTHTHYPAVTHTHSGPSREYFLDEAGNRISDPNAYTYYPTASYTVDTRPRIYSEPGMMNGYSYVDAPWRTSSTASYMAPTTSSKKRVKKTKKRRSGM